MTASADMPAVVPPGSIQTRRTFANVAHMVGGEAILRVANFVAAVLIARLGGTVAFGVYATTLAYATVAVMPVENGLVSAWWVASAPIVIAPAKYAVIKILLLVRTKSVPCACGSAAR